MHDPAKGELHSPGTGEAQMVGIGQVQEPHKGGLGRFGTLLLVGRGAAKIDGYSEVRVGPSGNWQGTPST